MDVVEILTDSSDYQTARKYWNKLKQRLKEEGSKLVTFCHRLKLTAQDGKLRETDAFNTKSVLRLVQSIPSKKAEPFKVWLAQVGSEQLDEIARMSIFTQISAEIAKKLFSHLCTINSFVIFLISFFFAQILTFDRP